jgi:hypothetical protein
MNRNTITRQITTTEENIRRLMEDLENSDNKNVELANCQNKVDRLFGKLSDNHSTLTADVKEMLDNLRAGKVSPDELEKLLVGEREKVSYSLNLADNAKKSLENVMAFVQHFVNDVERGKPVPKDSFSSLYHELDNIADSMNSMSKVHHTKDIEKLKRIMQTHSEDKRSVGLDNGVVSLKHILTENNREAKERQQKRSQGNNNRTTIVSIGSLARPRSSQNLMDTQGQLGGHRLASPDMMEMIPPRVGSPSPLRRTGTAGSMGGSAGNTGGGGGGGGASSPGKGFDFNKTGQSLMSTDENDGADVLSLHGRQTAIKQGKKAKKQGKREKRLSSAVIYGHTEDDTNSVGSSGGHSLTAPPAFSLADFVPPEGKKMQMNQSCQTDDVAIQFNQDSVVDHLDAGDQEKTAQGGNQKGGKKSAASKRKSGQKKDGKAVSMVSARCGSRENNKAPRSLSGQASLSVSDEPSRSTSPPPSGARASSKHKAGPNAYTLQDEKHSGQGSLREQRLSTDSVPTQEYFKNYADKPGDDFSHDKSGSGSGIRTKQERENAKIAGMSPEEAQHFLNSKEQRLLLLELKLQKQQEDMVAVIDVKVAEEVAKTQNKISATTS